VRQLAVDNSFVLDNDFEMFSFNIHLDLEKSLKKGRKNGLTNLVIATVVGIVTSTSS
jgi:predicted RNase H-related nuclease YkuK (DUF458 family)